MTNETSNEIIVLTDVSMIITVVQRGMGDEIVKAASEAGARGATIYYGRGTGVRDRLGILGMAVEVEKELVNILVSNDQVDEILERIYKAGKLDTPGMGIAYVLPVEKAATHVPQDLLDKLGDH
ncbi:MAG: P-II family nitrogen regulator [Myxococcota bacterium]|nr:P-II family nitrogen regulator [Myxococcota bacterium]